MLGVRARLFYIPGLNGSLSLPIVKGCRLKDDYEESLGSAIGFICLVSRSYVLSDFESSIGSETEPCSLPIIVIFVISP